MDVIRFASAAVKVKRGMVRTDVEIFVNDRALREIMTEVELPFATAEGQPVLAGSYGPIWTFDAPRALISHFRGESSSQIRWDSEDKTVLMGCGGCGEMECWPLTARITFEGDLVRWTDFEQEARPDWRYDVQFTFERKQYEAALSELSG
jgi:hypothetical protein